MSVISVEEEMDSSRFYINPYEVKDPPKFLRDSQLKGDLISKVKTTEERLFSRLENVIKRVSPNEDHTVYTGYSGIAYLYLLKHKKTEDDTFLFKAKELIDKALTRVKGDDISFLLGDAGPLAMGAVIYHKLQDSGQLNDLIKRLLELPQKVTSPPFEVLYGYAGYLYALLYLKKEIGPVVPDYAIKQTIQVIINGGRQKAKSLKFPAPLFYEWYDTNYLGAAHGVSGILYMLLCANEYLTDIERDEIIKPTIDWLAENRFTSGNFKSVAGRDSDRLVHWCHGSPGVIYLYLLASKIFENSHYSSIAQQCGDVVWQRGILKKGYSICHGVSGNAYAFMHLYKATDKILYLHRTACFVDWCTNYPQKEGRKPDSLYSLFEGISGVAYFLNDCQDPKNASFPAFALH